MGACSGKTIIKKEKIQRLSQLPQLIQSKQNQKLSSEVLLEQAVTQNIINCGVFNDKKARNLNNNFQLSIQKQQSSSQEIQVIRYSYKKEQQIQNVSLKVIKSQQIKTEFPSQSECQGSHKQVKNLAYNQINPNFNSQQQSDQKSIQLQKLTMNQDLNQLYVENEGSDCNEKQKEEINQRIFQVLKQQIKEKILQNYGKQDLEKLKQYITDEEIRQEIQIFIYNQIQNEGKEFFHYIPVLNNNINSSLIMLRRKVRKIYNEVMKEINNQF